MKATAVKLCLLFACMFQSCIVDEEPNASQSLTASGKAITKAPWKLVSYKRRKLATEFWKEFESDSVKYASDSTRSDTTTFRGSVSKCYPDDVYTFKGNGSIIRDNGLISCFHNQSTIDKGFWKLDTTKHLLTLSFFGVPVSWTINKLTEDSLELETPVSAEHHQAIFLH